MKYINFVECIMSSIFLKLSLISVKKFLANIIIQDSLFRLSIKPYLSNQLRDWFNCLYIICGYHYPLFIIITITYSSLKVQCIYVPIISYVINEIFLLLLQVLTKQNTINLETY